MADARSSASGERAWLRAMVLFDVPVKDCAVARGTPQAPLRTCSPHLVVLVFWLVCLCGFPGSLPAAAMSPEDILDRVDDLYRSNSSHGSMTMIIATRHWQRSLSLEFWAKGRDRSLVRIIAPKKEEGTATLRAGTDIWNYLPKVKRVIKLPSSMMSASWMGSHFTNDDLVKESRLTEDYHFKVTYRGLRDGQPVIEIDCVPKPDAAVVWGKVQVTVRQGDY
jgi:hypothetical protein